MQHNRRGRDIKLLFPVKMNSKHEPRNEQNTQHFQLTQKANRRTDKIPLFPGIYTPNQTCFQIITRG